MTNKEKSKIKFCVRLLKEDGINSKKKVFGILEGLLDSQLLNALTSNQTGLESLEITRLSAIELLDDLYDELIIRIPQDDIKGVQGVFLGMRNDVVAKTNILYGQVEDYLSASFTGDMVKELIIRYAIKHDLEWGIKDYNGICHLLMYLRQDGWKQHSDFARDLIAEIIEIIFTDKQVPNIVKLLDPCLRKEESK